MKVAVVVLATLAACTHAEDETPYNPVEAKRAMKAAVAKEVIHMTNTRF